MVSHCGLVSAEQKGMTHASRSPGCAPAGAAPAAVGRLCCQGMLVAHVQVIGWHRKQHRNTFSAL